MNDSERVLEAARVSLRDIRSVRDFLEALQAGAVAAVNMLDQTENALITALELINENHER
jgi:hypothetical protein